MNFYSTTWLRLSGLLLGPLLTTLLTNCTAFVKAGLHLVYEPVALANARLHEDLPYWQGSDYHPHKHRLDLAVPDGKGWPVMIFVHGGGWNSGDKDFRIGGDDIYRNIGRYYANRGIGVAIISYRLLPNVTWREQVRDVARAIAWVNRRIGDYGGDPEKLFLSGHSAGAQLVARATLDASFLGELGLPTSIVKGVVAVSGVGYDMVDPKTYELGVDINYLIERFRLDENDPDWQSEASPITFVQSKAPPFLLIHGESEWIWLRHQNTIFAKALREAGVPVERRMIEGEGHRRMALSFSHPEKPLSQMVESFVHEPLAELAR